jgi:hypothetical protein
MNASPAMFEAAFVMANVFGPLYQAGDHGENQLACAQVNASLLQREPSGRLAWHSDNTCSCCDSVYWRSASGGHGFMCPGCHGLTQIG